MDLFYEKLPLLAEFEPGYILFLIIWALSSFFSKKNRKAKNTKTPLNIDSNKVKRGLEELFKRLEHFQADPDVMPRPHLEEILVDDNVVVDVDYDAEDIDAEFVVDTETISSEDELDSDYIFEAEPETAIIPKAKRKIILNADSLKEAIVLKEILDRPRALRPFTYGGMNDA